MKLFCSRHTSYPAISLSLNTIAFVIVSCVVTIPANAFQQLIQDDSVNFSLFGNVSSENEKVVTANSKIAFDISAGPLNESLQQLSSQASLQLLYEPSVVSNKYSSGVKGLFFVEEAIQKLLENTDVSWRLINGKTIAITNKPTFLNKTVSVKPPPKTAVDNSVALLSDVDVTAQAAWWDSASSNSVFGLSKPLLETPRSVSFVNGDAIDLFSLSAVEDLLRVVPGVFTTTRFGVQGSVDIRSVPADTYFRGMRRLTLQGHGRSVLAAMDFIEVVGGPAAPLHGMGKIGGYVNFVPKSGRSKTGQYLDETHGFTQLITGDYNRRELSFGFGGPLDIGAIDKSGGYYVYGLVEDSDSYAEGVPVKQALFQAATSIDDAWSGFRLETGVNYQESRTSGALIGRFTQNLVDDGDYIGGAPLVNLDLNNNGTIGYLEMQTASPVVGNLSSNNQPLQQFFSWPKDENGNLLSVENFPVIQGIPESLFNYLNAHPEADPDGLLRAQGIGGPLPISGSVPIGMPLDPRTVGINEFNPRRSAAFEKDVKAEFLTFFADLVYDTDPDFTTKNQFFYDSMSQYKNSNQPFSQIQDVFVVEDKLTITKRIHELPFGLRLNQILTFNIRNTVSEGKRIVGDYGNHRTDATSDNWNSKNAGMTANTTFTSSNENADLLNDGMPWGSIYRTEFSEIGLGFLFDMDFAMGTNLLIGARHDGSQAENINYAERYLVNVGNALNPGAYAMADEKAEAWDSGSSWSMSLSQPLPYNVRPYATLAKATILLDGNNNTLLNDVINAGHVGSAELKEAGLKAVWLDGRLHISTSAYEQGRVGVSENDIANVINAYATSTTTRGWQTEIKWIPRRDLLLTFYSLSQKTRFTPNVGGTMQVDARALGFADVLDANGNVIYPAEAFLYGGRAGIILPNGLAEYETKQGNPEQQYGLTAIYQFNKHWGLTLKGNYLSSTCSGRLCLVTLPSSLVFDAGIYWSVPSFDIRLDAANVTDEHYFRARTGDTLGDVIAQSMPGRRVQLSANFKF